MKGFKTGTFLVACLGMFPETVLMDTIQGIRNVIRSKGLSAENYRIFRINRDGLIQRCNSNGKVI
jgi:hypothetical protein